MPKVRKVQVKAQTQVQVLRKERAEPQMLATGPTPGSLSMHLLLEQTRDHHPPPVGDHDGDDSPKREGPTMTQGLLQLKKRTTQKWAREPLQVWVWAPLQVWVPHPWRPQAPPCAASRAPKRTAHLPRHRLLRPCPCASSRRRPQVRSRGLPWHAPPPSFSSPLQAGAGWGSARGR
jgi:hypothetical protein